MSRSGALFALLLVCAPLAFATPPVAEAAPIRLPQADGSSLFLDRPARRIVTLAPSLTEQAYAAGAGDLLVAVSEYSDYPPEAARLPRIGDAFRFDLERIVSYRPDLVIGWESGNPESALAALEALDLKVWRTEVRVPDGIAEQIEDLGRATGRVAPAAAAALQVRERLDRLRKAHLGAPAMSYFYQVAERPLYTVSGDHLISRGLAVCGAVNVFGDLPTLAPQVSREAVLRADPDALVAPAIPGEGDALAHWQEWPRLKAVRNDALLALPADQINRATPRLLDSIELACNLFDGIRDATTDPRLKRGGEP